jgi:hypothetical protein
MKRLLTVIGVAAVLSPAAFAVSTSMHPELGAKLAGKNEVPKGSPTAHGIVNLTLSTSKRRVCWTFELAQVSKPQAAHIHKGRAGTSGPVFIPLGSGYKTKGCTSAPKSKIEAVESHPNAYYVNVHDARYPSGVVRGQLVAGMVHM